MNEHYDLIVIGAGPGGYVAAIRAAQLGMKVACVDAFTAKGSDAPALGGTCLNVGCIPSKALLDSSRQFHNLSHRFTEHGIAADNARIDVAAMIARKDRIVSQFNGGVAQLFKANKVTALHGFATLHAGRRVTVKLHDGSETALTAVNVVLAAGSIPVELPFAKFDGSHVLDNAGILDLDAVPGRLGIIGAGVIGLEMGSVWSRLGSEVTILEALPDFLAAADADVAKLAAREFKKQGLDIRLGCKVSAVEVKDGEVTVSYHDGKSEQALKVDRLLVSVGRRAAVKGLLADDSGVGLTERGFIAVDAHCHTGVEGVWAIGDCVRGPMLAHKASEEGIAVAERIAGLPGHVDFNTVPWVIYTEPEIAWVGQTERDLKDAGIPYNVGSFPFAAIGRAVAMAETAGMVKVLAHAETDRILGMHLVGPNVSELVHEGVVAMEFKGSAEDLARICHAHPTLSEAVHEAALAVDKRAIHKAN